MNTLFYRALHFLLIFLLAAIASFPAAAATEGMPPDGAADLYAVDPVPMTPQECGQCHTRHFGDLKENGGRHRFDCRECHEVIHAYNPVRGNYADLMPACSQCHSAPHGEKHSECLGCHANPHAAAAAPSLAQVKGLCSDCHSGPAAEMKEAPSEHAQQECQSCHHDRHGYVPTCGECHSPHFPEQQMAECASCHPVHRPLDIALGKESGAETCRQCHGEVVQKWSGTASRHGQVGCGDCHSRHGMKPACQSCHGTPHSPQQLAIFPNCLDCHLDVHDLPVKQVQ